MKKIIALVILMAVTSLSFAQKDEMKALEKAIKNSNFADAQIASSDAEKFLESMSDKTKAKFYFLKAKALYANGAGSDENIDEAIVSLDKLTSLESSVGKLKYTAEANEIKTSMFKAFITKANEDFKAKDFKSAAKRFNKIHKISPKDTLYLYNAAYSAVNGQDFENAIGYFEELKSLGYTGIRMDYFATNNDSGKEELFSDKPGRDFSVKIKTHNMPRDVKTESKKAEIVKNIALIYISLGENEKAIGAISDARAENPDDINLLLSEANVHLKMGNKERFKVLMQEATLKDPNNAELQFNLGVIAADADDLVAAKEYYQKAITVDPNYANAYTNLAVVILKDESKLVEEMNGLGNSSADNRRYDELKGQREQLYKDAIPYLEKSLSLVENSGTMLSLMNLYSVLGDTSKYKEMKLRKEQLEAKTGGN